MDDLIEVEGELCSEGVRRGKLTQVQVSGVLDEFVQDAGPTRLTVWILAWRCKRCKYTWPIRKLRRLVAGGVTYVSTNIGDSKRTTVLPKKCPGCDSSQWWRDYCLPLTDTRRARPRKPLMSKAWVRTQQTQDEEKG